MDNDKYVAIIQLRMRVAELDMARSTKVVDALSAAADIYPESWEPYKEGVRWHGYYFRVAHDFFDHQVVIVRLQETRRRKTWYGAWQEYVNVYDYEIRSPRDLLYALEERQPADG